jgi:hypothetical protein
LAPGKKSMVMLTMAMDGPAARKLHIIMATQMTWSNCQFSFLSLSCWGTPLLTCCHVVLVPLWPAAG